MGKQSRTRHAINALIVAIVVLLSPNDAAAQPSMLSHRVVTYSLLPGSTLLDDCPPCGRPSIPQPLSGQFDLSLVQEGAISSRYELSNLIFKAGTSSGRSYKVSGAGSYTVQCEVDRIQGASLAVQIDDGITNRSCFLTNGTPKLIRPCPFLDLELVQSNGTFAQVYHLHLLVAPIQDLWFSTATSLTSSKWNSPTNQVTSGDLLSMNGAVTKRSQELTAGLGILSTVPDPRLDAATVSTDGEILFSLKRDVFSDMHGWLQHGDLLSDTGRLVRRNQDLCAAFFTTPSDSAPDQGLDAVQLLDSGEIYFSIQGSVFFERLGVLLNRGDLLSDHGVVVKSNKELLARFHPPTRTHDYGLDAIHVWPSGEIWFSLEEGFMDGQLGAIQPGDRLSDQGSIVVSNHDLLNPFAPIEALSDFGLDALVVITNALPVSTPTRESPGWKYALLEGSLLTDDCSNCDRRPIIVPMRGGFELRAIEEGPLFSRYAIQNLSFTAGNAQDGLYKITGHGTYRVGGEVALVQEMVLELLVDDGMSSTLCYLTNEFAGLQRRWPMISVHVNQTNGTELKLYRLDIAAAPLQEIWFSTTYGFHPGVQMTDTNPVSGGDMISSAGRVVKRNNELTARLGFMPIVPDVGLDAVDILPGGEIAFSMQQDLFSESLGSIHDGDVLSNRGRVLHTYSDLFGAFVPQPPTTDQGLDALSQPDPNSDEIVYSIKRDFFSEKLGIIVRRGDLLSSRGVVVRTNQQLISRLNPADPTKDYGLDAIWVWPNGEIWFSTESSFIGQQGDTYQPGDILSDQGYVVYRHLELLNAFKPVEDLADFGLDALFIVTDAAMPMPGARFTSVTHRANPSQVELGWESKARVFQIHRAQNLLGPYLPASEIVPDSFFDSPDTALPTSFYQVRQW